MAQNTFLGPGKLKICFCGCVNTCSYCLAATVQMRLLPSFSISVSRLLMADSATPDFGDPSNQKVHVYNVPPSAAIFPSSLARSLRDVSDSTVQKEQLGLCAARGFLTGTPHPPNPISVALGYRESFAFVIRCLC